MECCSRRLDVSFYWRQSDSRQYVVYLSILISRLLATWSDDPLAAFDMWFAMNEEKLFEGKAGRVNEF